MAGGRGELAFRDEMRGSAAALRKAAQEAAGPFLREKLGRVDWFVTLTYDRRAGRSIVFTPDGVKVLTLPAPDPVRIGPEKALRDAARWRQGLGKATGRAVGALFVVEPHSLDYSSHVHGLVNLAGGVQHGDFQLAWLSWFWDHGYVRIERPRAEGDVCDYCSKYAFKDADWADWRLMGRRR